MEEIILRFHQIGKKIFEELNNHSLVNCRKVNGSWRNFIDGEKTISFRIIKSYSNVPNTYLDKKFGKANCNTVRELARNVQHVYSLSYKTMYDNNESKVMIKHLRAHNEGHERHIPGRYVTYCKISKRNGTVITVPLTLKVNQKTRRLLDYGKLVLTSMGLTLHNPTNPKDFFGTTPLHHAAKIGYLHVCKLIAENVQDLKNIPASKFNVRSFLKFDQTQYYHERNPADVFGVTPLDLAQKNDHSSLIEYFQSIYEEPSKKRVKRE